MSPSRGKLACHFPTPTTHIITINICTIVEYKYLFYISHSFIKISPAAVKGTTRERPAERQHRSPSCCVVTGVILEVLESNETEHREHLKQLFARLDQYDMVVNPTKCVFARAEIQFLGYTANEQGTKQFVKKVKVVLEFPKPVTMKQLCRFLHVINFY